MSATVDRVLQRLHGVKRNGSGWMARCPAHDDQTPSLSIFEADDGRVLLKCFAGCEFQQILSVLKLKVQDLFPRPVANVPKRNVPCLTIASLAADKGLPQAFLRSLGLEESGKVVRITYRLEDGRVADRQRIRSALRAKDGSRWSQGPDRPVPYGLWKLGEASGLGYVVLVEGESDCWTLWFHQIPALGIPGAQMTSKLEASHLAGLDRLYVVREPDSGGHSFTASVAQRLDEFEWQGTGFVVDLPDGVKDPNDLHKRDPSRFKEVFREALTAAQPLRLNASSAESWEPPIPLHEPSLPSFPTQVLPRWLSLFVKAEATATQTPEDLAAMVTLAVIATACAKKFEVEVRTGWREPLNIFTVTALPPGNRKSAVFKDAVESLEEFEQLEARRLAMEIAEARSRRKILEKAVHRAQEDAARASSSDRETLSEQAAGLARKLDETTVPISPRLTSDDITPERLVGLLHEHGGRMAVMSSEGEIFDLMAGRYSANSTPNFTVYLKGHSGDTIRVDRVGRPPEYVEGPALTLGLTVQPEVIRGLADKPGFRGRGLLGRFLYAMPTSLLGCRQINPPTMPGAVRDIYTRKVLGLLRLPLATDNNGHVKPDILILGKEAREALHRFEVHLARISNLISASRPCSGLQRLYL